jgi:predicted ester cyclase
MAGTDDRLARNREVVHRFYRAVNSKHREEFYEIVHKDFVNHGGASGDIVGPKALVDSLDPFFAAMPDWHVTEDYVLAENDKIAERLAEHTSARSWVSRRATSPCRGAASSFTG